jgi:hypothetical protein
MARCTAEHYETVNEAWQIQNESEIEAADREVDRAVVACLRDRGHDIDQLTTEVNERLQAEAPTDQRECLIQALDERRSDGGG